LFQKRQLTGKEYGFNIYVKRTAREKSKKEHRMKNLLVTTRLPYLILFTLFIITLCGCPSSPPPSITPVQTSVTFFSGSNALDTIPPFVVSVKPEHLSIEQAIECLISLTFSEEMDASSISTRTFSLFCNSEQVAGVVSYSGNTAVFKPLAVLSYATGYIARITMEVRDLAGNSIQEVYAWNFTTRSKEETKTPASSSILPSTSIPAAEVTQTIPPSTTEDITIRDSVPPEVVFTNPANKAGGIPVKSIISATFSEAMDSSSISAETFLLKKGTAIIKGAVSYLENTAKLIPEIALSGGSSYKAILKKSIKDQSGNYLVSDYEWTFTTAVGSSGGGGGGGGSHNKPSSSPTGSPTTTPTLEIRTVSIPDEDLPRTPEELGITMSFVAAEVGDPGTARIRVKIMFLPYFLFLGVENGQLWIYNMPQREDLPESYRNVYDDLEIDQCSYYDIESEKYLFTSLPSWLDLEKYDPDVSEMPYLISVKSFEGSLQIEYHIE